MTVDELINDLNSAGYLTVSTLMSRAFRLVEKWCKETGLSVNPQKTGLVLFTRRRKIRALNPPKLFGVDITKPNDKRGKIPWSHTRQQTELGKTYTRKNTQSHE